MDSFIGWSLALSFVSLLILTSIINIISNKKSSSYLFLERLIKYSSILMFGSAVYFAVQIFRLEHWPEWFLELTQDNITGRKGRSIQSYLAFITIVSPRIFITLFVIAVLAWLYYPDQTNKPKSKKSVEGWWIVHGSERKGPFDLVALRNMKNQGLINHDTYIWKSGFEGWKKAGEVDSLKLLLNYL